ncbi:hypothetical protein CJF30_00008962 [Rutstroemia sp. NJR-2017a BBW]|nr:hypothetical protein CJF30_00008962 [Rutstroemia sp. NJR-2017a BBW]
MQVATQPLTNLFLRALYYNVQRLGLHIHPYLQKTIRPLSASQPSSCSLVLGYLQLLFWSRVNDRESVHPSALMSSIKEWMHLVFDPSPLGLAIAIILALSIPIFLHTVVFRASGLTTLPTILLIGPSGSGKTALLTLFERENKPATTHTSQAPLTAECSLPVDTVAASNKYRSVNDPTNQVHKKFLLVDTPGHGKLRHHAFQNVTNTSNLRGVIFVVDATTLGAGEEGLREAADYLHDLLIVMQKLMGEGKSSKAPKELPILIAANKMDLFTALPAALVKSSLEREITKVRVSRSKGLLDSGVGLGDEQDEEKDDWLGEMGSEDFKFSQMEEFDISVEVAGGNVLGADGASTESWWRWKIGALRYNIHEAEIAVGKIGRKPRVAMELRRLKMTTIDVESLEKEGEKKESGAQAVSRKKRKTRDGKRGKIEISEGKEVINLDGSSTEDETASETESEDGGPARKKLKSSTEPSTPSQAKKDLEKIRTFKVLKVDWYYDSVKAGKILPMDGYLVYEGRPVQEPAQDLISTNASPPSRGSDILARAVADAKSSPSTAYMKHGNARYHKPTKSVTRPTHLLHQTTSEHDDPEKFPPLPDYLTKLYSCERPTPLHSPNDEFINLLKKIKTARQLNSDAIGVRAYSTLIASIAAYPYKLTSPTEVLRLPGCDQKTALLFQQYQQTGTLAEVTDVENDARMKVLLDFYNIWGVGDHTAREFYSRGWRDRDDIIEYGWERLTRVQQIGVKYYDEFLTPIPAAEVEDIGAVVLKEANEIIPGYQMVIVGGHRRGKPFSGDVDIMLTHPDPEATLNFVPLITDRLEELGWVTNVLQHSLANSARGQAPVAYKSPRPSGSGFDTMDKALVVWRDIRYDKAKHEKNPNIHRRVDIIITPWKTAGCGILGWSGGTTFQRDLRRYVRKVKDWKFDSSGMRDRRDGEWLDLEGSVVGWGEGKLREKEMKVFEMCGLAWREPWERCTG